ncbi:hypothetical protein AAMO2058_000160500 [Amorphochlora amoebiformis]
MGEGPFGRYVPHVWGPTQQFPKLCRRRRVSRGVYHFLFLKPDTTRRFKSIGQLKMRIPDTIIFSRGKAISWYAKAEKRDMTNVPLPEITTKNILKEFRPNVGFLRFQGICCAIFQRFEREDGEDDDAYLPEAPVLFLNFIELQQFLREKDDTRSGILQKFVYPNGNHNEVFKVTWSYEGIEIERKRCIRDIDLELFDRYDRFNIYEGPSTHNQYETRNLTLAKTKTVRSLMGMCVDIVRHISQVARGSKTRLSNLVLYFKMRHGTIYFLSSSKMEMDINQLRNDAVDGLDVIKRIAFKRKQQKTRKENTSDDGPAHTSWVAQLCEESPCLGFAGDFRRVSSLMAFQEEEKITAAAANKNVKKVREFVCPKCQKKYNLRERFRVRVITALKSLVIKPTTTSHKAILKRLRENGGRLNADSEDVIKLENSIADSLHTYREVFGPDPEHMLVDASVRLVEPRIRGKLTLKHQNALQQQVALCGQCVDESMWGKNAQKFSNPGNPTNTSDTYYEFLAQRLFAKEQKKKPRGFVKKVTKRLYPSADDMVEMEEKKKKIELKERQKMQKELKLEMKRSLSKKTLSMLRSWERQKALISSRKPSSKPSTCRSKARPLSTTPRPNSRPSTPYSAKLTPKRPEWRDEVIRSTPLFTELFKNASESARKSPRSARKSPKKACSEPGTTRRPHTADGRIPNTTRTARKNFKPKRAVWADDPWRRRPRKAPDIAWDNSLFHGSKYFGGTNLEKTGRKGGKKAVNWKR